MTDPRIIIFDIESTHLKANFGYCLCFGYKQLGASKTTVLSIADYPKHAKDPTNDAALMKDARQVLTDEADIIVSFYGKEFDRKFLNTRMLLAGLAPLPPLRSEHVDLYYTARYNLALHSNRLAVVAETLGCPMKKTPLTGPIWIKAMSGDRRAISYIEEHCARDVDVLEWCYMKLRPFIRQHPPAGQYGTCRVCGENSWQRRGRAITTNRTPKVRIQCRECGAWSTREEV